MEKNYDFLNICKDKFYIKLLNDEKIIFSCNLFNFNDSGIRQTWTLIITHKNIYNWENKNLKRTISLELLDSIVYSNTSCEFVFVLLKENDLRYSSLNFRDNVIECLIKILKNYYNKDHLKVYYFDKINLNEFVTTRKMSMKNLRKTLEKSNLKLLDERLYEKTKKETDKKNKILRRKTRTIVNLKNKEKDISILDFEIIKLLGKGTFGKVVLGMKIDSKEFFAIKILNKDHIIETDQMEHLKVEKMIMKYIKHPFLVSLNFSFQTETQLFLVSEFMKGGELYNHFINCKKFDEEKTKFYISCLVWGIGHLHNTGYIHRDLKLENILLDENGYCKLTDFGLSKFIKYSKKAQTMCGTPDYVAPEIILNKGHNKSCDWWSLGILLYEMLFGVTPFYDNNSNKLFNNIIEEKVFFNPKIKIKEETKDLINKLLNKNPETRLGAINGNLEIMNHEYFKDMNWSKLIAKKIKAPFIPNCKEENWENNFNKNIIKEKINVLNNHQSKQKLDLINQYKDQFDSIILNK